MNQPTARPAGAALAPARQAPAIQAPARQTAARQAPAATWADVAEAYYPHVLRVAYRLTGNRADAEDLAQETFWRFFRSYDPAAIEGSLEALLGRIATNLFLDGKRREARVRMEELSGDESLVEAPEAGPERLVEALNANARLTQALGRLSPDMREALVMCDVEGRSYQEIADKLGVALGTVRSRLHRARAQARLAIDGLGDTPDAAGSRPARAGPPARGQAGRAAARGAIVGLAHTPDAAFPRPVLDGRAIDGSGRAVARGAIDGLVHAPDAVLARPGRTSRPLTDKTRGRGGAGADGIGQKVKIRSK
jgi:RNA polymerase sigma-70 factor (ECF subfamily)